MLIYKFDKELFDKNKIDYDQQQELIKSGDQVEDEIAAPDEPMPPALDSVKPKYPAVSTYN
mgnify:CR=1 FL=1